MVGIAAAADSERSGRWGAPRLRTDLAATSALARRRELGDRKRVARRSLGAAGSRSSHLAAGGRTAHLAPPTSPESSAVGSTWPALHRLPPAPTPCPRECPANIEMPKQFPN